MAKKYARLLSGEAYAAGWFDSWRDYLKKKQMAESMAKKYATQANKLSGRNASGMSVCLDWLEARGSL